MTQTHEEYESPIFNRLRTGFLLIAGVTALVLWAPQWLMIWFLAFVLCLAMLEFLELNPVPLKQPKTCALMLTTICVALVLPSDTINKLEMVFLSAFTVVILQSGQKSLKTQIEILSHVALGSLYLIPAFYFIAQLVFGAHFQFWFFTCVTATALGDTFAYFVGRTFGKHKLAPVVSPNKTWEGAFGALIGGAMGSVVLHQIYQRPEALWQQVILGVVLAIIGIYGDLAESAIKRAFGVKDSGNILPGHGGVVDRIDAYLFTLPAIYFYSQWIAK